MTSATALIPRGTWVVDRARSRVSFAVKAIGIPMIRGEFTDFEGALEMGENLSSAKAYGTVEVASIDTGEHEREVHLRLPDLFEAAQYPEISFESTAFEPLTETALRIIGSITMHGVTREITLQSEVLGTDTDPRGKQRVGLAIKGELSHAGFGMRLRPPFGRGGGAAADMVKLALDISAVKQS